jgi:hypothetical protein
MKPYSDLATLGFRSNKDSKELCPKTELVRTQNTRPEAIRYLLIGKI